MKRVLLAAATVVLVGGCATPSKEDVADFNRRNLPQTAAIPQQGSGGAMSEPIAAAKPPTRTAMVPSTEGVRIIVVGNVMALQTFDQEVLQQRYDVYAKQMSAAGKTPQFSKEWYFATSAGETQVKFAGVTGLYHRFFRAEVPKDLAKTVSFSSAFGVAMVGSTGDLVVAERTEKTGTWVTQVLCSEKDPKYTGCLAQYKVGVYQGVDGKEIDDKLRVVSGGATIDLATFRTK